MSRGKNLQNAKTAKNDEYYTLYEDIEKEMNGYIGHDENVFAGKTVVCPCDDYDVSNFAKYFVDNFEKLKLKQLITSCYVEGGNSKIMVVSEFSTMTCVFNGDGDFRNEEVRAILNEADFVITNPPFSLFRDFIDVLEDVGVQYSIIGSSNAVTYKSVFPLIKDNKLRIGVNGMKTMKYLLPDGSLKAVNSCFYTTIKHNKPNPPLVMKTMAENIAAAELKKKK